MIAVHPKVGNSKLKFIDIANFYVVLSLIPKITLRVFFCNINPSLFLRRIKFLIYFFFLRHDHNFLKQDTKLTSPKLQSTGNFLKILKHIFENVKKTLNFHLLNSKLVSRDEYRLV